MVVIWAALRLQAPGQRGVIRETTHSTRLKRDAPPSTPAVSRPYRLAILSSHVIQYAAPLYQHLATQEDIDLTVYYCSSQGLDEYTDSGFGGQRVQWDIPLLEGYRSEFLPNLRAVSLVDGFWSLINPAIVRELRRNRYDAVWIHGHNYATSVLAYMTARMNGTPVFTRCETHLGLSRSRLKRMIRKPLLGWFYRQCDACLAIGSANREFYQFHGVPASAIFDVPYAVDNARFTALADLGRAGATEMKRALGIQPALPVVLFASKFILRKHPMDLLRTKEVLESKGVPCVFLMVGAGSEEPALREYCAQRRLKDVHFLGFRNQRELPALYALSDVFVLPSENEPWGLIINEVMCAGLAIVAAEGIGAVRDLVKDGENGFLFPPRNVEALASALAVLVSDRERCAAMGRRSVEIIGEWSYASCVRGVRSALNALAEQ